PPRRLAPGRSTLLRQLLHDGQLARGEWLVPRRREDRRRPSPGGEGSARRGQEADRPGEGQVAGQGGGREVTGGGGDPHEQGAGAGRRGQTAQERRSPHGG